LFLIPHMLVQMPVIFMEVPHISTSGISLDLAIFLNCLVVLSFDRVLSRTRECRQCVSRCSYAWHRFFTVRKPSAFQKVYIFSPSRRGREGLDIP
jgi:hypothetical protein